MTKVEYDRKVQWLRRYLTAMREVNILTDEIDQLRAAAEKVTPRLSCFPGGGSGSDSLPRAVEKIIEAQKKLECQIDCAMAVKSEVDNFIEGLKNERSREIMRRRYILGQKWEAIACDADIDYRWLLHLHHNIVASLEI